MDATEEKHISDIRPCSDFDPAQFQNLLRVSAGCSDNPL